jgi:hypothetical protein
MPPVSVTMQAWKLAFEAEPLDEAEDEPAAEDVEEELDELEAVDFEPQPAAARATTAAAAAILVMWVVRTATPPDFR